MTVFTFRWGNAVAGGQEWEGGLVLLCRRGSSVTSFFKLRRKRERENREDQFA